jgi:hypothetical protein
LKRLNSRMGEYSSSPTGRGVRLQLRFVVLPRFLGQNLTRIFLALVVCRIALNAYLSKRFFGSFFGSTNSLWLLDLHFTFGIKERYSLSTLFHPKDQRKVLDTACKPVTSSWHFIGHHRRVVTGAGFESYSAT